MITLEKTKVYGWEEAIRGMRNPMNSWERSDSFECVKHVPVFGECEDCPLNHGEEPHNRCVRGDIPYIVGENDHDLMMKLAAGGPVHAKYRRMITVYVDITAPLYWWKEFDTYKVGTVANSCSTMHKIHAKKFDLNDFSLEHLSDIHDSKYPLNITPISMMEYVIDMLNICRDKYLETKDKKYWWQMIQLLPSSYNQKRTVMLNYEVLAGIYPSRKDHKLDEWHDFCHWVESLPYSEIITGSESVKMAELGKYVVDGFLDGIKGDK